MDQRQTDRSRVIAAGILQRKYNENWLLGPQSIEEERPISTPPIVHQALKSSGRPLDEEMRSIFEPSFGHDFSKVRVYDDMKAQESAKSMNALAYTVGNKIVFGERQYAPKTIDGRNLLAHELFHVKRNDLSLHSTPNVLQMKGAGGSRPSLRPRTQRPEEFRRERMRFSESLIRNREEARRQWERGRREIKNEYGVHSTITIIRDIMDEYTSTSGLTGTSGPPANLGQAIGVALDHIENLHRTHQLGKQLSTSAKSTEVRSSPMLMEASAFVRRLDNRASEFDIMRDLSGMFLTISSSWEVELLAGEHQLFAIYDTDYQTEWGAIPVGIATDKHLLKKYAGMERHYIIKPWKKICGKRPYPPMVVARSGGKQMVWDYNKKECRVEPAPFDAPDVRIRAYPAFEPVTSK
jgi:hypothetical protein